MENAELSKSRVEAWKTRRALHLALGMDHNTTRRLARTQRQQLTDIKDANANMDFQNDSSLINIFESSNKIKGIRCKQIFLTNQNRKLLRHRLLFDIRIGIGFCRKQCIQVFTTWRQLYILLFLDLIQTKF